MFSKFFDFPFLVLFLIVYVVAQTSQCSRGQLTPPTKDVNYNENIASLGLPFCNSQAGRSFGDPVYYRYGGGYTVRSPNPRNASTGCLKGQEALFDANTKSSWYRGPTEPRSVIFQTQFISPFGVAIWNSGTGWRDVRESRLDFASSVNGPWTLVREMTLSAFYNESTPQFFSIDNTELGFHQYWKWTILSVWTDNEFTAVREFSFYVQPTARRSPNVTSPAPFYLKNRNAILKRDLRVDPITNYSTTIYRPYSLIIYPGDVHYRIMLDLHWVGVAWTAESVNSGLSNWALQTWSYQVGQKIAAPKVVCNVSSAGRRKAGLCLATDWPTSSLYQFATTDKYTEVKLSSFELLFCEKWDCPESTKSRPVGVTNVVTNLVDQIETIRVLDEEKCTTRMEGPSTAILF